MAPLLPTADGDWRAAGLAYHSLRFHLARRFGKRVRKVSVDAGFTCPNVDGTVTTGGCNFCDNRSFSPSRRIPRQGIRGQIDEGVRRIRTRYEADGFLAYFQPATNTYAPVERLRAVYEEALGHPEVVGLAIGTRPDCVPEPVAALVEELAARTYVSLELGMQSMHDRSLDWMNRGHHHAAMIDAMERLKCRSFEVCAHLILGIPGESRDDMLASAREAVRLGVDAVKIHNLYAVRRTPLGEQVERGEVRLMERDEYVRVLVDMLELLPPSIVVERISGEAPRDYFLGPAWCKDKPGLLAAIAAEFERRGTHQGERARRGSPKR